MTLWSMSFRSLLWKPFIRLDIQSFSFSFRNLSNNLWRYKNMTSTLFRGWKPLISIAFELLIFTPTIHFGYSRMGARIVSRITLDLSTFLRRFQAIRLLRDKIYNRSLCLRMHVPKMDCLLVSLEWTEHLRTSLWVSNAMVTDIKGRPT